MKKWLVTAGIVILLAFLGSMTWLTVRFWPLLKPLFHTKLELNTKSEWKTYAFQEFGITLESPFHVTWELQELTSKTGKSFQSLGGISSINLSGYLLSAHSIRFPNKGHRFDPDRLQETIIYTLQHSGYEDQKWETRLVECSGMPATLTTGSYISDGENLRFSRLLIVREHQFWQFDVQQKSPTKDDDWIERTLQSVRITP